MFGVCEVFVSTLFWMLQKLLPLHPQQLQGEEESWTTLRGLSYGDNNLRRKTQSLSLRGLKFIGAWMLYLFLGQCWSLGYNHLRVLINLIKPLWLIHMLSCTCHRVQRSSKLKSLYMYTYYSFPYTSFFHIFPVWREPLPP